MAAHAELEGEVLIEFVTRVAAQIENLRSHDAGPVRRILDIGSGPGVGTCELARCFPEADVVAIDGSAAMLERTTARAQRLGLSDRIRVHTAELPDGLETVQPVDMIWASMSLHHIGDEVNALRLLKDLLNPGGLIAIAEMAEPMQMLPSNLDIGRPGLADRVNLVWSQWFSGMRQGLPGSVVSADLPSMVAAAGFDVLEAHLATVRLDAPLPADALQLVLGNLRRTREGSGDRLDEDDRHTLDVLTDPDDSRCVLYRDDVFIAASRHIVIAKTQP